MRVVTRWGTLVPRSPEMGSVETWPASRGALELGSAEPWSGFRGGVGRVPATFEPDCAEAWAGWRHLPGLKDEFSESRPATVVVN